MSIWGRLFLSMVSILKCIKLFVCEADLETLMLFVSPSVAMLKIRMTGVTK